MKMIPTEKIPRVVGGRMRAFGKACAVAAAFALSIGTGSAGLVLELKPSDYQVDQPLQWKIGAGAMAGDYFAVAPWATAPSISTKLNAGDGLSYKGVDFSAAGNLLGGPLCPASLGGSNPRTIETWVWQPANANGDAMTLLCLSRQGGPDNTNFAFVNSLYNRSIWALPYVEGWNADNAARSGKWVHLVASYDGAELDLYVNGAPDKTNVAHTFATESGGSMSIGMMRYKGDGPNTTPHSTDNADGWNAYRGLLGSMRVYDEARTATQVANDYALGVNYGEIGVAQPKIVASAEANGGISPSGDVYVAPGNNQTFTFTPNLGYAIDKVLVDTVNNPAAVTAGTYTFTNVTVGHTIAVSFAELPKQTVSGLVTDGSAGVAGAKVFFNTSPNASVNPIYTTTTGATGSYSYDLPPGNWYVTASELHYFTPADATFTVAASPVSRPPIVLTANPNWQVLFSLNTDDFSGLADGARILTWEGFPAYNTYNNGNPELGPTVEVIDGVKWEKNVRQPYNDSTPPTIHSRQDGFALGTLPAPIATEGVSIVAVVKPQYKVLGGEPRGEIVDICYGTLFLATNRNNGEVIVCTKGYVQHNTGYFIPDGQKTILSLVVQPGGLVKLYANGVQKWSFESGANYTTLEKYNNFDKITVGRNGYDDWSVFNGNLGDINVFRTALGSAARKTMEGDLATKFGITLPALHTITTTATNGTISPGGDVDVEAGTDQTFNFIGTAGLVDVVTVDGQIQAGHPTSYTFTNVQANHNLNVTFTVEPPPANDNFAGAINLPGDSGTQTGTSNFAATTETGEPDINGSTNTVWFKWTATANGNFTVGTDGSTTPANTEWDAILAIYTGTSVNALTQIQPPKDTVLAETVTLGVTTGTTYYIQVAGFENDVAANLKIGWSFVVPPPANPYGDWAGFYFTPGSPESAMGMDPDNDGWNNLQEYAFDEVPTSGTNSGHMRTTIEDVGGQQALLLTVAVIDSAVFTGSPSLTATAGGVVYTIEGGNDLSGFNQTVTEVTPARSAGMPAPFTGWVYRTFRLSGPISAHPAGFLRVRTAPAP